MKLQVIMCFVVLPVFAARASTYGVIDNAITTRPDPLESPTVIDVFECGCLCGRKEECAAANVRKGTGSNQLYCDIMTYYNVSSQVASDGDRVLIKKVDLTPRITSCSASSTFHSTQHQRSYPCENVYGGVELASVKGHQWVATSAVGGGDWLQVTMDTAHVITSVSLLDRCRREHQTSAWNVQLGSAPSVTLTKPCGGTDSWSNCTGPGNGWFTVDLPSTPTDSVTITIDAVCVDASRLRGLRAVLVHGVV